MRKTLERIVEKIPADLLASAIENVLSKGVQVDVDMRIGFLKLKGTVVLKLREQSG